MRDEIIREIKRVAAEHGGTAPGRQLFERETGIKISQWLGIYWARWGDALVEAGLTANEKTGRLDKDIFLEKLAQAFRHYGRVPTTTTELRMYRQVDPTFPAHSSIDNHFGTKAVMIAQLRDWTGAHGDYADVRAMLPANNEPAINHHRPSRVVEGFVYLIRSGGHYKIGRSDEIERRVKEIRIALPEAAILLHTIRTDDPAGIEAYWHRRFADKRANGEWFRLTSQDVSAFGRRKYQ